MKLKSKEQVHMAFIDEELFIVSVQNDFKMKFLMFRNIITWLPLPLLRSTT